MFALGYYEYNNHEFYGIVCVSTSKVALQKRYTILANRAPLAENEKHHKDLGEINHYYIEKIEVI